ncbi:MAG TPA: NADP-dependent oxidoreductase [Burkholderiaceae bacterium]|nr:NADP-dependent oxidoreductase [Burkholderiaceae bacterium]
MEKNRRWVLANRPKGAVSPGDFRLEEADVAMPSADGEGVGRNHYMSLDPYMRGRMDDAKSYAAPQKLDEVMGGGTAGEVVASKHPGFAVGDKVVGMLGWQLYGKVDGKALKKVDTRRVPLSAHLGVVGMPGVTAWVGLNTIIEPKAGQTVVVSAASGAVGATVGQLAKLAQCRVVGVAGGPDKCRAVVDEFGFDACIDYKAGRLYDDLKAVTPDGIDGYFENVGGEVLDAVLRRMNAFGRIAVCGLIAGYDGQPLPVNQFRSILINRLKVQGFIVSEHPQHWPPAQQQLAELVGSGRMKYRETVAQGLDAAPEAFIGLLKGRNFGKQLVKLV